MSYLLRRIAAFLILICLYNGFIHILDGGHSIQEIGTFLLGDYIQIWNSYIQPILPNWDSPFVLILGLAIGLILLSRFQILAVNVVAFIIALLIFKTAMWYLGVSATRPPNWALGGGLLLFILFIPKIGGIGFLYGHLVRLYRKVIS